MTEDAKQQPITIDLNQFRLRINLKKRIELTLDFNSPSRKFYLSLIAFIVNEMKRLGKITSIPLEGHLDILALLNETIGEAAGSSEKESLLPRIYRKWQQALPNLEEAPLFKVAGKKKGYDEGIGKTYPFTEAEKDGWANLFEYKGSEDHVRLKFAVDRIGAGLNDVVILYEGLLDGDAWEKFVSSLKGKGDVQAEEEKIDEVHKEPGAQVPPMRKWKTAWPSRYRWIVLIAVIGSVLGAGTWAIWKISFKPAPIEVASIERMAFPLPDKPSIAVLPFANMCDDPKQAFLSDGITENIITALSKIPGVFVISRQSTFLYKGKPVNIKQVSEELGVRYVMEGSVQKFADRIRISTQLIDALTGHHLWSGRYDRDLMDLFALQDEITIKILTAIRVKLTGEERAPSIEKHFKGKQGLDCYLKLMEANDIRIRWNIADNNLARRMMEEVIAMCPDNPMGYVSLGWATYTDYMLQNTKSPQETIEKGIELAQKVLAVDDSTVTAHILLGYLYHAKGDDDKAMAEAERAVALNPSGVSALVSYANNLRYAGRPEESIPFYQKAIRLNPLGGSILYREFGFTLQMTGRFEEAVSAYKKAIQFSPNDFQAHLNLAVVYSMMGRGMEARAEAAEVLRLNPKFSVDSWEKRIRYSNPSEKEKVAKAMREAGLK